MLTYALTLALTVLSRQSAASPAPLSPATLPPPPVVAAKPVPPPPPESVIGPGVHTSFAAGPATESADVLLRKAVAGMTGPGKCAYAEVNADGISAWGYKAGCRVTAFVCSGVCVVTSVSRDQAEAERTNKLVAEFVQAAKLAPDAPKKAGVRDAKAEEALPGFAYHGESRPMNLVAAKHFLPTVSLVLQKRGFQLPPGFGPLLTAGAKPDSKDPNAQFVSVLCITPDDKQVVYIVCSSWGGPPPLDTPMPICTAIVKMLHD